MLGLDHVLVSLHADVCFQWSWLISTHASMMFTAVNSSSSLLQHIMALCNLKVLLGH